MAWWKWPDKLASWFSFFHYNKKLIDGCQYARNWWAILQEDAYRSVTPTRDAHMTANMRCMERVWWEGKQYRTRLSSMHKAFVMLECQSVDSSSSAAAVVIRWALVESLVLLLCAGKPPLRPFRPIRPAPPSAVQPVFHQVSDRLAGV